MSDYAAAPARTVRTATAAHPQATTTRTDAPLAARTAAASSPQAPAREALGTAAAGTLLPARTAGRASTITAPVRTVAGGATRTNQAGGPNTAGGARLQAQTTPSSALLRVFPLGAAAHPSAAPARTAAAATARGDTTGGGTAAVRPVVGQLWPRARATASST